MKFTMPLIVVSDLKKSREFYEQVLGQKVTLDLGQNITFEDRFALQADYKNLVGAEGLKISFQGNDHKLYFEEDNFDDFLNRLQNFSSINYLHKAKEYPWGQRVVRFYDPDFHIIEIGESMAAVFQRFRQEGLSLKEVAIRTGHPIEFVQKLIS